MDRTKREADEKIWTKESITEVEISILENIIGCRTVEAVEAAISYSHFLSLSGMSSDNYPLFMKLLGVENHWVIDTMVRNKDPFLLMSPIQPNSYLMLEAFKLLTNWHPGGIYPTTLSIVLGILQAAYSSPKDGFKIYRVSIGDVNNLGKHLNKETGQDDPNNRCILDILDRLGSLAGTSQDEDKEQMARQANNIRTFFFDKRKKMEDIIPQVLLVKSDYVAKEIAPEQGVRRLTEEINMKELFEKKQTWERGEIAQIEYNMLKGIMGVRTQEAVEAAITYAHYLNSVGITNGNYPVFLKLLRVRNHHVIDALLGTRDPFLFMSSIQPNYFIVATCFSFLSRYRKGEIYPKTLGIILGVFQATYSTPLDGYKIYPPTIADVNSLGKHLNEDKGQDDLLNRSILDILDKISSLEGQGRTRTWKTWRCMRTTSATTSSTRRSGWWT